VWAALVAASGVGVGVGWVLAEGDFAGAKEVFPWVVRRVLAGAAVRRREACAL
jgi:hypothetical protein